MAVYGNTIFFEEINENAMSPLDFIEFLQESDYEMDKIFNRFNLLNLSEAENTSLSVINNKNYYESEEVKKTFIEKVKDIIKKFIDMVKKLFNDIYEKLHKFYIETNFVDKFVSRYKDKVTYINLQKALDNGWPGLTGSYPVINRVCDITDSDLYRFKDSENSVKIDDNDFDSIIKAENLEEAKENYEKFKEKLEQFKKESLESVDDFKMGQWFCDIGINITDKESRKWYGCYGKLVIDEEHYMPSPKHFMMTKVFAETGEGKIKNIRQDGKRMLSNLKLEKEILNDNMKSFKKNGNNSTSENEVNQCNILYYKSKYEYAASYISRMTNIISSIIKIIKEEHTIALKTYMQFVSAINKFAN